jgi:hypothetical protein
MPEGTTNTRQKDTSASAWAQGDRRHGLELGCARRDKEGLHNLSFNQKTTYAEDIVHALRSVPEKDFDAVVRFLSGTPSPMEITGTWAIFKNLSEVVESDRKEVFQIAKKTLGLPQ